MQRSAEIDEAEATAVPALPRHVAVLLGRDDRSADSVVDVVMEEQLLRGLESNYEGNRRGEIGQYVRQRALV